MFQYYIIGKLQFANAGHFVTLHSVRGDIPTHAAIISVNLTIIFWMYNPTSFTSVVAIKVISASLSNFYEKCQITTISSYGVFLQYLTEENIFIEVISLYNFFDIQFSFFIYLFFRLKLGSAIFYQIFIFHQMIALQKLWKMFFISSKNLFSFLRYLNFCIFIFPSFFPWQPLL